MQKEARFYEPLENKVIRCGLCPHFCVIREGAKGLCLIRKNINGRLIASAYGEVSALAVDPIEKKPLYHFHPASRILSIGSNGCNLRCDFCQNWHISMNETRREQFTPSELVREAVEAGSIGIAYTYNEPLINYEFVYDCAAEFRRQGLKNVLVTNGFINSEPLTELLPLIDAANIDLKGFTEEFYREVGGRLDTVKASIKAFFEAGICTEVTNLVIPTKNDDEETFTDMCRWIASISRDIPLHISAYFPAYKSTLPPCRPETVIKLAEIAESHLNYVYTGNLKTAENDSLCPYCKAVVVKRNAYGVKYLHKQPRCNECEKPLYFFF